MKLKILTLILLTTLLQGCYPTIKETGVEMLEKCYDGVVYIYLIAMQEIVVSQ